MSYYFEIWLRGFAKDYVRNNAEDTENFHPHITFARPFYPIEDDNKIQRAITNFCQDKEPIAFTLQGADEFSKDIPYIPIIHEEKLLRFDEGLENVLDPLVNFYKKLNPTKILHVATKGKHYECPSIDQYMLRLTGIKDEKIWFSYDLVTKTVLNREESLDKKLWHQTVNTFSEKYKLIPTRQGFQKI